MRATLYHSSDWTVTAGRPAARSSEDAMRFRKRLRTLCLTQLNDATTVTVPRRDHVYTSGSKNGQVYVIESGQVKTFVTTESGKRCLLSIYTAGEVIGELGLLGQERRESAAAMTRCTLRQASGERFLAALTAENLLPAFVRHLGERVQDQQNIIADMATMGSERRLAARLLYLAGQLGTRHGRLVLINARITQEELADMIGTTRSRVGFFLKRFREAGLVRITQTSLIVDSARLADYVDCGDPLSSTTPPYVPDAQS
ncbi:Crp/Fnr family transcriptional regulator [Streptomyces sp. NBC_01485]|uniref:Crp/Fnr family transcriptional regulator n=1 Tax=Streptomyces sp. NBC_01485 TaxID=2903884 RepID=UPI002E31E7A5|nr:Crp/Fnr family transcriptional regulator [Streptomyces sp. NBC_01485]